MGRCTPASPRIWPAGRQQHNDGTASRYTRSRRPVKLVYQEPQRSQSLALKREAAIKKLTRRQKLALIRGANIGNTKGLYFEKATSTMTDLAAAQADALNPQPEAPSRKLRLFFWVILGAFSVFFAEVTVGSSMFPFFEPFSVLVTCPLYALHILVLAAIVLRHPRPLSSNSQPNSPEFGALRGRPQPATARILGNSATSARNANFEDGCLPACSLPVPCSACTKPTSPKSCGVRPGTTSPS